MPLSYLVIRYFSCLGVFIVGSLIVTVGGGVILVPFLYLGIGIYMSRTIERVVTWSEHLASLADVARAKRSIWIGWPFGVMQLIRDIWVVERM